MSEWSSAIRLPSKLMDVTSSMSKKEPPWVRLGFSINRLLVCSYDSGLCKHKRGLFCREARWRIFVTWLGQLLIMFAIATFKRLGFRILTVNSFILFQCDKWFSLCLVKYCLELVEKYSEAQVYKSKPKTKEQQCKCSLSYSSAEIFESVVRSLFTTEQARDCKCWIVAIVSQSKVTCRLEN